MTPIIQLVRHAKVSMESVLDFVTMDDFDFAARRPHTSTFHRVLLIK